MGSPRLERLRDARELLAVAEPLEPRTTHLVDALLAQPRRGLRVHVARDGTGRIVGAVVLSRLCLDRWFAFPLVLEAAAAPAVAAHVDRSRAWLVLGFSEDVEAVEGLLRRGTSRVDREHTAFDVVTMDGYGVQPDPRFRIARPSDLDRLVRLYAEYELDYLPSMARLRRDLRRDLARDRVVVLEEDGALLGAFRVEAATRRFQHWSHLTVDPDCRGRNVGIELGTGALLRSRDGGVWASWARHPSNPLALAAPDAPRPGDAHFEHDRLSQVRLRRRVPALRTPWRALEILEGRRRRRPKVAVDPARHQRSLARYEGRDMIEAFEDERRGRPPS